VKFVLNSFFSLNAFFRLFVLLTNDYHHFQDSVTVISLRSFALVTRRLNGMTHRAVAFAPVEKPFVGFHLDQHV
jgi:hypothetical protein